jgi:hypothetical protein
MAFEDKNDALPCDEGRQWRLDGSGQDAHGGATTLRVDATARARGGRDGTTTAAWLDGRVVHRDDGGEAGRRKGGGQR